MRNHIKFQKHNTIRNLLYLPLMALLLATQLCGCSGGYRNLRLPQLQNFEKNIHNIYPESSVTCKYQYESGVSITVKRFTFSEDEAYTVLRDLQPVVSDEHFIQDLFALFEKESHGDPNWELGRRPEIMLYLTTGEDDCYQFTTRAYQEGYNSGFDPDSYTWDGYTTWYGTKFMDDIPQEITSEQIIEAVQQYS